MKKYLILLSLGVLSLSVTTASKAQACRNYVIEDDYVNVRTSPSTQHSIVGRAYEGSDVNVVGRSGGWLRITFPHNGWVSGNMIGTNCRRLPDTNSGGRYPYTEKLNVMDGDILITIRQTPTWAELTKQERKSARENMWWDYLSEYSSEPLTVDFYTSRGYHIAQYSSRCRGRCFTKE